MALPPQILPSLGRALEKKGYSALTEVQEAVIATDADGADMLVSAQTGSGKTVAFGLAIAPSLLGGLEIFQPTSVPLALVVAPTRELALQVQRELVWLFGEARGRVTSCVGGMDPRAERRELQRGTHIVVGTPGRLRDHIERGALDMSGLRAVVLDEADEMLDFGFREDLEFILDTAPADRRTLMFSATVPRAIATMAKRYQKDALRISTVSELGQHVDIEYRALSVAPSDKENAIINILRFYDAASAIVFCKTRQEVNRLSSRFGNRGFSVVSLSGELSQNERTHALQAMRDGRARVCVATDVAARGIDLPGLELVIHADLPTNSDVLKHRSGRTGRAGKKGICALIVPHTMRRRASRLLQGARVEAEWGNAPSLDEIRAKDTERLLSDPSLSASYDEDALVFARELLERHGPEQVAAAFLKRCQAEMPAAEELLDAPIHEDTSKSGRGKHEPREREPRAPREDFGDSVWFTMTAGKKERAEPRWLLPIICRLGHVTKREVGSIKIGDKETRFEIKAQDAERFMEAVTASGGGEKSIRITRDDGKAPKTSKMSKPEKAARPPKPPKPPKPERANSAPEPYKVAVSVAKTDPADSDSADAPSDESWVPELSEMERPEGSLKPKLKGKKKKEKWTRAKKNAAKNKRTDAAKRRKSDDKAKSKAPTGGDQVLKREK